MNLEELYRKLLKVAQEGGYYLNPDKDFTIGLLRGLLKNESRYGYMACPCRLALGKREEELDIICPCDYRDADLSEYGTCYCGLYVSEDILTGKRRLESIPERRKKNKNTENVLKNGSRRLNFENVQIAIWRCKVCGYLCAREKPPEKCPICKVPKERFEMFSW